MSERNEKFVKHLVQLSDNNRGALAVLRRGLGFAPGAHSASYPYVERFVGVDKHAQDPGRLALYTLASLFAAHPKHVVGTSLATALARVQRDRGSGSIEARFIALLDADADSLPVALRTVMTLLAGDGVSIDFVALLGDVERWMRPHAADLRDQIRQRWARDYYRVLTPEPTSAASAN